ncbi:sugar ABC transporter substrate-binding protein [Bacillus horti]|uniref:Ribose transport system substrate-binding protein n=1 Tax=Caldalkalibacillus horti TaxID=77523 RepID=A0ABT9W330_9BACI|nr:substrate-binding domain-containing protein [Bacillus horti]MDQ0167477.1 ribose transport system substrate-binding protein [Bacillus horti]
MQKLGIIVAVVVVVLLCHFTFTSAQKVLQLDNQLPRLIGEEEGNHRLVLITQDRQTPFWDKVAEGAIRQAEIEGVSLEVWGSYGMNKEDFLKNIEVAIHSKVNGILVQGLDSPEFKELTKVKASFHGIPIITVANDVPMEESLRRTYVGSDQYTAGQLIADELIQQMVSDGQVVLMYDREREYYQRERIRGIKSVLNMYSKIEIIEVETDSTRDQVKAATRDVMNRFPQADAYIPVNANHVGIMISEISKRSQLDPFLIYTFDDGPEAISLLAQGIIDGVIEQEPEKMGEWSVQLLVEWLNGETVPLNHKGYLTDLKILKVNGAE